MQFPVTLEHTASGLKYQILVSVFRGVTELARSHRLGSDDRCVGEKPPLDVNLESIQLDDDNGVVYPVHPAAAKDWPYAYHVVVPFSVTNLFVTVRVPLYSSGRAACAWR